MTQSTLAVPQTVVIVGGGIAALEAVLALHHLGAARVHVTLIAPEPDFVLRPMAVAAPFSRGHTARLPLAQVMDEHGGRFIRGAVTRVDAGARTVTLTTGEDVAYDVLVLAPGASAVPAFTHALTFGAHPTALNGILADLEEGWSRSIAFVVPARLQLAAADLRARAHDGRGGVVDEHRSRRAASGDPGARAAGDLRHGGKRRRRRGARRRPHHHASGRPRANLAQRPHRHRLRAGARRGLRRSRCPFSKAPGCAASRATRTGSSRSTTPASSRGSTACMPSATQPTVPSSRAASRASRPMSPPRTSRPEPAPTSRSRRCSRYCTAGC